MTGPELIQGIKRAITRLEADDLDQEVLNAEENVQFLSVIDDGLHSLADDAEGIEDDTEDPDDDDDDEDTDVASGDE